MDTAKLMSLMAQKKQAMKRHDRAEGFKPGKNRIRILQGWRPGEEHVWYHDFGQHFIKDATGTIQAVYVCVDATYSKPCSVCGAVKSAMRAAPDDTTTKILEEAVAGKAILINALHLDSDQPNTPKVTAVKGKLFTQLISMLEENGPEAFFDLEKGHEIVVTREGKGFDTTYNATMSIKTGTPIPAAVLKQLQNLDDYVKQESEEQERRAIAAVNTVAGFLPAPAVPATTASSMLAAPTAPITAPVGTRPAAAAAPAASVSDVALDSELDDLLGDLPQ
jgi:hypothetical protein